MEKVGLAAARAAMDEERVEAAAFRSAQRHGPGGCGGNFVGLADDERFETVARIEIGRVGIAFRRRRRFLENQQRSRAWRIDCCHHAHFADHRQHRLPRQGQPLAKMGTDPIRHELARHDDVERPRVRIERAELGRLQPAVEGSSAKVAAKSRPDRVPGCLQGRRDGRTGQLHRRTCPCALHWPRLPRLTPKIETKWSRRAQPSSRALGFFSLLPPARIRARKDLSEIVGGGMQEPFFHESEIKGLDIGNARITARTGRKLQFLWFTGS